MDNERTAEFVELHAPEGKVRLICSHVQRAFEAGDSVAVYVPDPSEAEELDNSLWTFAQNAFIPHVRLEEATEPLIEPVVLFSGEPGDVQADLLVVSTDGDLPAGFDRFPHVRDFAVLYDEPLRKASLARFVACRAAGYKMRMVKTT